MAATCHQGLSAVIDLQILERYIAGKNIMENGPAVRELCHLAENAFFRIKSFRDFSANEHTGLLECAHVFSSLFVPLFASVVLSVFPPLV